MFAWLRIWRMLLDLLKAILSMLGVPMTGAPNPVKPTSQRVAEHRRKAGRQYPAEKQKPHGPNPDKR